MSSWSDLPEDFKKNVVKKLDFLSRIRLRICSKSDENLVNSVPLVVENARVGLAADRCLIVIHTGIDEFLKIEVQKIDGKVYVRKSTSTTSNSTDSTSPGTLLPDVIGIFLPTCFLLQSLLTSCPTNNKILLNAFEWELNFHAPCDSVVLELMQFFAQAKTKFRAKRLVFNYDIPKQFVEIIALFCSNRDLRGVEKRCIVPIDMVYPEPQILIDNYHPKYIKGLPLRFSKIFLSEVSLDFVRDTLPQVVLNIPDERVYSVYRAVHEDPKAMFEACEEKEQRISANLLVKRELRDEVVLRHTLSPCGYWIAAIRKSVEQTVNWKIQTCGLAELCRKCSGPFSHDYLMDLPRRIVTDPHWPCVFRNLECDHDGAENLERLEQMVRDTLPRRRRTSSERLEAFRISRFSRFTSKFKGPWVYFLVLTVSLALLFSHTYWIVMPAMRKYFRNSNRKYR